MLVHGSVSNPPGPTWIIPYAELTLCSIAKGEQFFKPMYAECAKCAEYWTTAVNPVYL
jgi:hypothetical protein